MLNIKRKILVSYWKENNSASTEYVLTFGKVNPVKMIQNGYTLISQDLEEFVLSEEQFAIAADAVKKGVFKAPSQQMR